ncbi:MAG: hypothetical protein LBQ50_05370 [Planctomycetaceae bacterium]|jgi:hypothetical protein|nr:hypothetical protein [Planctomycetaceae bacterium]
MKDTLSSKTLQKQSVDPWWKFSTTTWLFIAGLVLLNIGCFLKPSILDTLLLGLFNLLDFRTWTWWYFLGLVAVLAFSVRWFLLYQTYINENFDLQSLEEAKWFCRLSGTLTFLLAVFIFLHRFSLLRWLYNPLYFWLGFGAFSFSALLIFTVIFVMIGFVVFLVWKWMTTLQEN